MDGDDLRRGIVLSIVGGHTHEEATELSGVSVSSVSRRLHVGEALEVSVPKSLAATRDMPWYRTGVRSSDGWMGSPSRWPELQARLAEEEVVVSKTAIFRFLRNLEFTLKKAYTPPNKTGQTWPQRG